MIYPSFVFAISMAVSLFSTLYAIPNLRKSGIYSFVQNDKTVRYALDLIYTYSQVIPYVIGFLLVSVFLYFFIFLFSKRIQNISKKVPLVNTVFFKGYYVGFRAAASGLAVGMTLSWAFSIASEVVSPAALKEEFILAKKRIEEGMKFSDVFTVLSDVERTLIDNAVKGEFLHKSFILLSERMKNLYLSRIRFIPPVIYAVSVILSVLTVLGLIGSVIIPYLKMIKGLSQ